MYLLLTSWALAIGNLFGGPPSQVPEPSPAEAASASSTQLSTMASMEPPPTCSADTQQPTPTLLGPDQLPVTTPADPKLADPSGSVVKEGCLLPGTEGIGATSSNAALPIAAVLAAAPAAGGGTSGIVAGLGALSAGAGGVAGLANGSNRRLPISPD